AIRNPEQTTGPTMPWYQLDDANDPKLDELARQYNLHPLHIEDARSADESVKVDTAPHYTFAVFKPVRLEPDPDNPGEQMPVFTDLPRVLATTRHASPHPHRDPATIIDADHQPYVRDTYDHIARLLDSVETQRDLLNNTLDIYLSSVANRTNEVMKVLTVLGTIVLPVLAISGIYGMNLKGLPFQDSPYGAEWVGGLTILATVILLYALRKLKWL